MVVNYVIIGGLKTTVLTASCYLQSNYLKYAWFSFQNF